MTPNKTNSGLPRCYHPSFEQYYFADRPNIKLEKKDNILVLKNMTAIVLIPQDADYAGCLDPESGKILDLFEIKSNIEELCVPDFQVDIALRVTRKERIEDILKTDSLADLILN